MKCCSMKLAARKEERIFPKTGPRCHPAILENNDQDDDDDDDDNTYRSKSHRSENDQPYLSVLNLIPPSDIKAFNTGSSIKRWANKRPRLKSARSNQKSENSIEVDSDSLDVPNIIKELQNDHDDKGGILENNETEEVDPDIQRLLEKTHMEEKAETEKRISFDMDEKVCRDDEGGVSTRRKSKRKHKKKSKDKNKDKEKSKSKKKLTKTVSFSLSKPPTPQTEQIIRVDVISNYSVEFEPADSSRTDAMLSECGKFTPEKVEADNNDEKLLQFFCSPKAEEPKDFILESKKAVLFPRNVEK